VLLKKCDRLNENIKGAIAVVFCDQSHLTRHMRRWDEQFKVLQVKFLYVAAQGTVVDLNKTVRD
jgi:hypothetical protein